MTVKQLKEILNQYDDKFDICLIPDKDECFPNFTFDCCESKSIVEEYGDTSFLLLPIRVDTPF